jgi:hypothetical protein
MKVMPFRLRKIEFQSKKRNRRLQDSQPDFLTCEIAGLVSASPGLPWNQ